MTLGKAELVSALVRNRKEFFDIAVRLEIETGWHLDTIALQGEIDSNFADREAVSAEEADQILAEARAVRMAPAPVTTAGKDKARR